MLEDLGAIQSRISEIQGRLASLTPPAPPVATPESAAPTFQQALTQAQGEAPPAANNGGAGQAMTSVHGITVPAAALGPLPPMSVTPETARLIPLASTGTEGYDGLIQTYATKHGLDPSLVRAVIHTESGGNPRAVSRAGAAGLMQLMPANVREAGISDPFDPEQNIAAGTQQLSSLLKEYGGDLNLALAGYNAGPGSVRKYGGVPPFRETQDYIRKVRAAMQHG